MDEGDHSTMKVVEKLDVEDEESRQDRIQNYLERLNSSSHPNDSQPPISFSKFDFGNRTTFAMEPPSELLSRVQAFLPQIEASNQILAQRAEQDPDSIDIEHIQEGVNQYIEMNLGLGVFEDRSHKHKERDEDSDMSTSSSSDTSDTGKENDADSDVDSDASSEIITSFVPSRPIKPLPRRGSNKRPDIVVLD
ncbi:hypothetical protein B0H34DRAFT_666655 [Crassisporium funariophilum]|nr:hypothetical protein B0H34DRAFT_666655 [Crassisporium funariophilum]